MSSLHSIYTKLESLVATEQTPPQESRDQFCSSTPSSDDMQPDSQQSRTTPNLHLAYTTLQSLAKELKPTIDHFFDTFISDRESTTANSLERTIQDDEEKLRAMNEKLDVFLAFCPGIRGAYEYLLEKEKGSGGGDCDGEIASPDGHTDMRRGG